MIIIPAIDIKDGRCVRLRQGKMNEETVYSDAPELMARRWEEEGAKLLHVVDLDGAVHGIPKNSEVIKNILKKIKVEAQVGGGIRDHENIQSYLDAGAGRVVLGTTAVLDLNGLSQACERFPQRIVVAIDSQDGKVAIRGWKEVSTRSTPELAKQIEPFPIAAMIITDINRDGMLSGPNISFLKEMVESVRTPIIASGGVRSLEDIKQLSGIPNLYGVIVGRALYEGLLSLSEAITLTGGRS